MYNISPTQLKLSASEQNLFLNPETISCDFEKGAIKALKFNFPSYKNNVCHLHVTRAIFKKMSELGLKTISWTNKDFKPSIRMLMSFPFLLLDDIDEVRKELKKSVPDIGVHDKTIAQQFIVLNGIYSIFIHLAPTTYQKHIITRSTTKFKVRTQIFLKYSIWFKTKSL